MHGFKDTAEREWKIRLTLGGEKAVFEETGVYLSDLSDATNSPLARLANDAGFLGQVVWTLCQKQAADLGVTQDEFLDSIDADTVDLAREAVIEETLSFLGHRGQALRAERKQRKRMAAEIDQLNLEILEGISGEEAVDLLEKLLVRSTDTDGSAEEFAESTLAT